MSMGGVEIWQLLNWRSTPPQRLLVLQSFVIAMQTISHPMSVSFSAPNSTSTPPPPERYPSTSATHSTQPHAHILMPPGLEQTLATLSTYRSVLGYLLLSRSDQVSIIKHSGVVFEGEQGRKYAGVIARMIESVQAGLEEVSGEENDGDNIRFMRIRTKRHELMISPDDRFLLAVLHDPAT